jgi:hypothetical protein
MLRYNSATDDRPIWPRNPWPAIPRPLSNWYSENPSDIPLEDAPPTQWSPQGLFQSVPYMKGNISIVPDPRNPDPTTRVATRRSDFYDASPNAWPNNGQWDKPNGWFAELIRLKTHTSAHPGKMQTTGAGPTMYFVAPPVFSMQTKPIAAVGI